MGRPDARNHVETGRSEPRRHASRYNRGRDRTSGRLRPGISRLIKHTEESLGIRFFERRAGLFMPSVEADAVFDQIREVFNGVENLQSALDSLQKGQDVGLAFASAPSVAQFVAARTIGRVRKRYPDLFIDLNFLKIEETLDYLLLERGEFVIMSSAIENPGIENRLLASADFVAVLPTNHPLAEQDIVSVHDIVAFPLIGVDPDDPYGGPIARLFTDQGLQVNHSTRGRFSQTVVSLVRRGMGDAVIDRFSVAEKVLPGFVRRRLQEQAKTEVFAATKKGRVLSGFAELAIKQFRRELVAASIQQSETSGLT